MRPSFRQFVVPLFVLVFLADAMNIDALFEYGAVQREDDTEQAIVSVISNGGSDTCIPSRSTLANFDAKSQKVKLEIVDIDSPSLEATYVGADQISALSPEGNSSLVPLSARTTISLYSLCRIQV